MTTPTTPANTAQLGSLEAPGDHPDVIDLARHLSPAERARLEQIETHVQQHIRHQSISPWNSEQLPHELIHQLGALGLGELGIDGSSPLLRGLIHTAVARADLSLSALIGIHNELIVGVIHDLGSLEQKQQWLPGLRQLRTLGAFCMTEPDHGSDIAGGLSTTATLTEGRWHIQGAKRWIGMGTMADLAVVWARDTADDAVKGFLVPTTTPGYQAHQITGKTGLRIMQNADVELDLHVGQEALLPGATSFSAASDALRGSRAWVGWQAVGAQQALLDIARSYALNRDQFGTPVASFQLVQASLAQIAGNLAVSASFMSELTSLQASGELTMLRASLAKATLTRLARESAASARELLGGNGLLSGHEAAKVAGDIEAIYTYEGSQHINMLIVGRELTGISAFV